MSDPSDRDRVTAILTLAEAAVEGPWFFNSYSAVMSEPRLAANNAWDEATADDYQSWEEDDPRWKTEPRYIMAKTENITWNATDGKPHGDLGTADGIANGYFIAASRSETPWLARTLLEALDTIDRLEAENQRLMGVAAQFVDERREALDTVDRLEGENEMVLGLEGAIDEATSWLWDRLNGGNE